MTHFDHDYAHELLERARRIPEDRVPDWGKMNRAQVYGHLTDVFQYTMGRRGVMPDKSTWVTRNVFKRLLFLGLAKIPKNVRLPAKPGQTPPPIAEGNMETLESAIEEYLAKAQAGDLDPPRHPFFGKLSIDEWARFHVLHSDHHMRQFGV